MTLRTGSFLRSDETSWVSSSLFFMCINRLSLNETVYYIPPGMAVPNKELRFYVDHLEQVLATTDRREDEEAYDYVRKVCRILKTWAEGGFDMKVV